MKATDALLQDSTDKSDVAVTVKEPSLVQTSCTTTMTSEESLKKDNIEIAGAIALYWYEGNDLR